MTETDMFLRAFELNTTTGGTLVRTIVANTYTKLGFASLTDFLNEDCVKHQLFHLWLKQCCCKERIRKNALKRGQWLKMYRMDSSKCAAITHPPVGDCFCQYASPPTVLPDILDISLGETVMSIDFLKKEVSIDVLEALSGIKKIRNNLCHKSKMELNLRQYNEVWSDLTGFLSTLGKSIDDDTERKVQYDISSLQDKTYDAKDKIITSLLENMIDVLSIEENSVKLTGIENALSKQKEMLNEILNRLPSSPDTAAENECSAEQKSENGPVTIKIVEGDITQEKVDVIVNTTSEDLNLQRGSVSRRILKQGGQIIQDQLKDYCHDTFSSGMVAKTTGGGLPCSYIYHGWLPRWTENDDCKQKLSSFIGESLNIAGIDKMTSLAMPALGTGILGYPVDLVAKETFDTIANYCLVHPTSSLKEIRIIIYPTDEDNIQAFKLEEARRNEMFARS